MGRRKKKWKKSPGVGDKRALPVPSVAFLHRTICPVFVICISTLLLVLTGALNVKNIFIWPMSDTFIMDWCCPVLSIGANYGSVWFGLVWFGLVWFGLVKCLLAACVFGGGVWLPMTLSPHTIAHPHTSNTPHLPPQLGYVLSQFHLHSQKQGPRGVW